MEEWKSFLKLIQILLKINLMNLISKFLYHTSYSTFQQNESLLKFPNTNYVLF